MKTILLLALMGTAAYAADWSKRYTVGGTPELRVSTDDGRIEVRQGAGNEIQASVHTIGWAINSSEVQIVEHQDGNRVEVSVKIPKHMFKANWGKHDIEVELRVPAQTNSSLTSGDGSIHIDGIHGNLEANTGDGSVEALNVDGKVNVKTGDGHVTVRGRLDSLTIETGDGSIEAEAVSGSRLNAGWNLNTGDGSVTLRLPDSLAATLDAHTGDGSVTVDLPVAVESQAKDRHEMRGTLNGGGERLTIRSGDGSIHVQRS